MRAPDEIMLGLECCLSMQTNCKLCPYRMTPYTARERAKGKCREFLGEDAQELVKQQEVENAELMERLEEHEQ